MIRAKAAKTRAEAARIYAEARDIELASVTDRTIRISRLIIVAAATSALIYLMVRYPQSLGHQFALPALLSDDLIG
jgi:hypothetical protein